MLFWSVLGASVASALLPLINIEAILAVSISQALSGPVPCPTTLVATVAMPLPALAPAASRTSAVDRVNPCP